MELTKEEAKAAATAAAWTETTECEECGQPIPGKEARTRIHSMVGGLGADWDLADVLDLIDRSERTGWAPSIFGHELVVIAPYAPGHKLSQYRFAARAPAGTFDRESV